MLKYFLKSYFLSAQREVKPTDSLQTENIPTNKINQFFKKIKFYSKVLHWICVFNLIDRIQLKLYTVI